MSISAARSALSLASKPGTYGGIDKSSVKDMGLNLDYDKILGNLDNSVMRAFQLQQKQAQQGMSRAEDVLTRTRQSYGNDLRKNAFGTVGRGAQANMALGGALQLGLASQQIGSDELTKALQALQLLGVEQRSALAQNAVQAMSTQDANYKAAYDAANDKYLSDRTFEGSVLTAQAGLEGQAYAADKAYAASKLTASSGGGNDGGIPAPTGGGKNLSSVDLQYLEKMKKTQQILQMMIPPKNR
jgi:hypothetical protein